MVAMEHYWEIVCGLSYGTIANDLEDQFCCLKLIARETEHEFINTVHCALPLH